MGLRHEGKPLALSSGGGSGSIGRLFRATTLGARLRVRRPRSIGQNILIVDCFSSLFARVQELNQEDQRGVAEQLSEEELAIFDILTKPEFDMTAEDRKQVKAVARTLLQTLKEAKLVLDWRKRLRTRADVYSTVKTVLDDLPRIYSVELYQAKCDSVYRHVFDSYQGEGQSVYSMA